MRNTVYNEEKSRKSLIQIRQDNQQQLYIIQETNNPRRTGVIYFLSHEDVQDFHDPVMA